MCIHETIQLSQDGERIIVCGDCGREFAKIAEDEQETLVVPIKPGGHVLLHPLMDGVPGGLGEGHVALTASFDSRTLEPTYPCARCGFSMSCPKVEGEPCHT